MTRHLGGDFLHRKHTMDYFVMALEALNEPSTYRRMNDWCWENVKNWVKMAPTPAQFSGLVATDSRFTSWGIGRQAGSLGGSDPVHVWALSEWLA